MPIVLDLVRFLLFALWALVLGRTLMSWVDPQSWSGFIVLIVLGFLWPAF